MPNATKLGASTLKVADLVVSMELSDHTIDVLPFPLPLINM